MRIARLRVDERQRVVADREIRTKVDRHIELGQRLVLASGKPQRATEGTMRSGIAIVGREAPPGRLQCPSDFPVPLSRLQQEGVLEMRERQSGVRARK